MVQYEIFEGMDPTKVDENEIAAKFKVLFGVDVNMQAKLHEYDILGYSGTFGIYIGYSLSYL